MPASLPGATLAENLANPSAGKAVLYSLLSGPKGSPLDRDVQVPYLGTPGTPGYPASGNASTGGLSNGLGFGPNLVIGLTAPASIVAAGYSDDYTLGVTKPDGTASANSTLMYIGGGRSNPDGTALPYTAGFGIGGAGNGGSRDAGAGPAFTGFLGKIVTAAAGVANGAVVETGWVNRSGVSLVTGQSTLGLASAASATPTITEQVIPEPDEPEGAILRIGPGYEATVQTPVRVRGGR
jgi:hypothetical protein